MQLAGRGVIDDVFSLCFGSVEGDGALMLGDVDLSEQDIALQYTALLSSLAHPHYYSVQLESLWVGEVQLPVKPVHLNCCRASSHLWKNCFGTVFTAAAVCDRA